MWIPHQQRQAHPQEYREQPQEIVLDADHFVIEAEDVFTNEARGRMVRRVGYGEDIGFTSVNRNAGFIISGPAAVSTGRNRLGSSPAWWCASGSGPVRTIPSTAPRKCRSCPLGSASGISIPGTMSCFRRSSRTKKLWITSRECSDELDRLAHRYFQRRADDIVLAGGVLFVEAEGVAAGIVDQFEIGVAEFAVRPRIAETPGELLGQ